MSDSEIERINAEKQRLMSLDKYNIADVLSVVHVLRGMNGCPWDAEQTHESIRNNLVEEAYEVLAAIEGKDNEALYDELGDVLLQVAFHAEIGSERGEFGIAEICTALCQKMIRRHPHVFGNVVAETSEQVLYNWDEIKKVEKGIDTQKKALLDVPETLPALTRAYKIQKKAAKVGFDWDNPEDVFAKVQEELDEVREAYKQKQVAMADNGETMQQDAHLSEEIGDLIFATVNLSRSLHNYPEEVLRSANNKFVSRFTQVEQLALAQGKSLEDMSLSEMDELWEQVKRNELKQVDKA